MCKRARWTDEERKFLLDNYEKMGAKTCAIKMGRSSRSVICAARRLNLQFNANAGIRYTEDEDAIIHAGCASGDSVATIAKRLGRTYQSVFYHVKRLGLPSGKRRARWGADEDIFLSQNYKTLGSRGCAEKLGRSQSAVAQRIRKILSLERKENDD